ncbi:MAG: hypothetical protein JWN71_2692 [Xanthobacteraceae bacterium]|nr:hypothetical protein [Xanthobacteraceae bacterium]
MSNAFKDKIVVVTGGSRGIGRGIALAFAREGAQTVLVASSADNLKSASAAIVAADGLEPLTIATDLRELASCEQVFATVSERFGRCDVLINNAGATKAGGFLEQPDAVWLDGFALKFFGCVRLTRLFWPLLRAAEGHVVNIGGGAARTPDTTFLIGGAVNAAMGNFSKGLSKLGRREGVNVNVINPGMTQTERVLELHQQRAATLGTTPEKLQAELLAKQGLRRIGQPEDVAALAVFLCSAPARHIIGAAISVDGGSTPGYS